MISPLLLVRDYLKHGPCVVEDIYNGDTLDLYDQVLASLHHALFKDDDMSRLIVWGRLKAVSVLMSRIGVMRILSNVDIPIVVGCKKTTNTSVSYIKKELREAAVSILPLILHVLYERQAIEKESK